MNKSIAYFFLVLLVGCAKQTAPVTEPEFTPSPEIQEGESAIISPVVVEPVVPPQTAPVVIKTTEPKSEVGPKPEPIPKAKPKPVVIKTQDGKLILGSKEWVWLPQSKQYIKAKIESAQKLSILGVNDLQDFERDGVDWVRFRTGGVKVELPVERWHEQKGSDSRQAIVKLRVKLGELNELTDVILTTGKHMILGDNFIRDVAMVDKQRKFVQPKAK